MVPSSPFTAKKPFPLIANAVVLSDASRLPCVNCDVIAAFRTPSPTRALTGFSSPLAVVVFV